MYCGLRIRKELEEDSSSEAQSDEELNEDMEEVRHITPLPPRYTLGTH